MLFTNKHATRQEHLNQLIYVTHLIMKINILRFFFCFGFRHITINNKLANLSYCTKNKGHKYGLGTLHCVQNFNWYQIIYVQLLYERSSHASAQGYARKEVNIYICQ